MSARRALCRYFHGGLLLDARLKCQACATQFTSREEAGTLAEFYGAVPLDASRMADEEVRRLKEFHLLGYRVVLGGQIVVDDADVAGRRVMGGQEITRRGDAPTPKVAKPIPAQVLPMLRKG